MNTKTFRKRGFHIASVAVLLLLCTVRNGAAIEGLTGTVFDFTAKADYISTADGGVVKIWGYANGAGRAQYPGPTLIVNQGETITINLTNELPMPASIIFPGQEAAAAEVTPPSAQGLLTLEAVPAGGTVSYTFTADNAGTYLYHSGTRPELQVEMGLAGAIIVRPYGFDPAAPRAYDSPDTSYDHEYLFLLSEMDPRIHEMVDFQGVAALDNTNYLTDYTPNYWFINGRTAPDTMVSANAPWLPTQPYNCLPLMNPGDNMLLRFVSVGRDPHPFHTHGNHARVIARDGMPLQSTPGTGVDLSHEVFIIQSVPGETIDALWTWTGKGLGWDIYGTPADGPEFVHDCEDTNGDLFDDTTSEYCPDHDKAFPVHLPSKRDLAFGIFWTGSPFMGSFGALPPGEGGLNPFGGYTYMWHTHSEKEMCNFDIFPGGMMTMLFIAPHSIPIE